MDRAATHLWTDSWVKTRRTSPGAASTREVRAMLPQVDNKLDYPVNGVLSSRMGSTTSRP
jgi:hypothetical protein